MHITSREEFVRNLHDFEGIDLQILPAHAATGAEIGSDPMVFCESEIRGSDTLDPAASESEVVMASDAELEDLIVASIRRIVRAVDLHSRHLVEEHGITAPQLAVLAEAARLGGSSIGALARGVHLSQPTVSGVLDRLERRGLVQRERSDRDRRAVVVTVTEKGEKVLHESPSLLQDRFRDELGRLEGWERHGLLSALERIAAMMDAERIKAAPVLDSGPIRTESGDLEPDVEDAV